MGTDQVFDLVGSGHYTCLLTLTLLPGASIQQAHVNLQQISLSADTAE